MARYYFIIISLLFLLGSCGQVGTITGGDDDVSAPKVLLDKVSPPMGSINSTPEKITIPFDEFIALNKPAENIRITPSDVKMDYSIKGKSLILKRKEGSWAPHTTYTIYLNRAVKDLTESNDSIMSYVFSTGSFIDSMQTAIQIKDAYTDSPLSGITVGLYTKKLVDDTSKVNAMYYALTDKDGIAQFKNIKNQAFYLYAFEDENRNNRLDATENRAALRDTVPLFAPDTATVVGPVIRLMPPENNTLKVVSNEVFPPATWSIKLNRPLIGEERFEVLTEYKKINIAEEQDSISIYFKTAKTSGTLKGVLHSEDESDTVSKKYFFKETPKLKIKSNLINKRLGVSDTLFLTLNEPVENIDTTLFELIGVAKDDSVKQPFPFQIIQISDLRLGIVFQKEKQEKVFLTVAPKGITGLNYPLEDTLKLEFSLQRERETGTMILEFDSLPPYGILFITNKQTKEVIKVAFDGEEKKVHQINHLNPGEYMFHYLIDEDRNGRWSTGSIFTDREPEKTIWISTTSTIRANWEVKTNLSLDKD